MKDKHRTIYVVINEKTAAIYGLFTAYNHAKNKKKDLLSQKENKDAWISVEDHHVMGKMGKLIRRKLGR